MNNGKTKSYVKHTNSGLYINYESYEPWHTKPAWIKALYDIDHEIKKYTTQKTQSLYKTHLKHILFWKYFAAISVAFSVQLSLQFYFLQYFTIE